MTDDEYLDAREVAALLKINYRTVINQTISGDLPGFKVGNQWRYRKRDIDERVQRKIEERRKGGK